MGGGDASRTNVKDNWGTLSSVQQALVMALYRAVKNTKGRIPDAHYQSFLTEATHFLSDYMVDRGEVNRWWLALHGNQKMFVTPCVDWCNTAHCKKGDGCPNIHPVTQKLSAEQSQGWKRFRGASKQFPGEYWTTKSWIKKK